MPKKKSDHFGLPVGVHFGHHEKDLPDWKNAKEKKHMDNDDEEATDDEKKAAKALSGFSSDELWPDD